MKKHKLLLSGACLTIILALTACNPACQGTKNPVIRKANATLLPNPLSYQGHFVPVINAYRHMPGCYVACYSNNAKGSAYGIGNSMYVHGLIRINGLYLGHICEPQGFFFKDISKEDKFKQLCSDNFVSCKNGQCWAGGDTGGFLGISADTPINS